MQFLHVEKNISLRNVALTLALTSTFLFSGCTQKSEKEVFEQSSLLDKPVTELADRDWAEIKQSGVLRMITSYSSGAYFLHRGIQVGFEYELVREFARQHDLALEVVIAGQNENPYELLLRGEGDLIAANYTITEERSKIVDFTRPYNQVNQIVVLSDQLGVSPESVSEMEGIPVTIRRNSSYYQTLLDLQEAGFPISINMVPEEMDTETLLFLVANGTYEATVADDNIFNAVNKYMGGLNRGPMVSEGDEIAWAIRKSDDDLETRLNQFLYKHYKYRENGVPKRSEFLNILRKRYYEGSTQIADYFNPEVESGPIQLISPYDSLLQTVATEFGLDWVMLTAIAAQESKFDPRAVSWAGAVGLLQVLPRLSDLSEDS